jgi:predicted DsbA family dithiol-disulfide isomerase
VGQQRLHRAIQTFGEDRVSVEWKPFQIDPGTNLNGEALHDYCRRRFGGSSVTDRVMVEGRKDGAHFANWQWWPSTGRAHQLVQYCGPKGKDVCSSDRVNALLFQAEYEKGENVSLVDVLVRIGQEAGLPDSSVGDLRQYLTENCGKADVEADIALGRQRYSIKSVPYFIVSSDESGGESGADRPNRSHRRPYGLSGAQSSDTFVDLFEELTSSEN